MLIDSPSSWSGSERRTSNRFPIAEDLNYRVFMSRQCSQVGAGRTINISSSGVLFTTETQLTPGKRLEIAVNWPAQLNNQCPLKLIASGRIVRVEDGRAAIQIDRYEFRTRGSNGLLARTH